MSTFKPLKTLTSRRQVLKAGLAALTLSGMSQAIAKEEPLKTSNGHSKPKAKKSGGKRVVVLDPGHGGIDTGAIGRNGSKEKHVVLAIAKNVRSILRNHGIDARLTRSGDTFIPLYDRVEIAHKHGLLFIADCARCFENAFFIKEREPGYADKSIADINREVMSYFDYAFMSIKKDGLVNMGGFFCCREQAMYDVAWVDNMNYEGHCTYGGLAGRDLNAIAVGLYEGSDYRYLKGRIGQVQYLGERLDELGIPYVRPVGGNGVYIDARKFYPDIDPAHFPGLCLAADLYMKSGVRVSELGASAFSYKDEQGVIHYPEIDLVRIAISRRVYTNSHMDVIAETLGELYKNGSPNFKGMDKSDWYGATTHFTSNYTPMWK